MSSYSSFPTHLYIDIKRCKNCPAFLKHGAKCNLKKERTIYTPLNADPPEWCPLRQQPVTLVLKEK